MNSPRYYTQALELDIEPNLTDIDFGATSLDFEVDDTPEYDEELGAIKFESVLELELECYPNSLQDSGREPEEKVGNVETEVLVIVEGSEDEFEEYISTWETDGYRAVDWGFRYHIESGFTTEVFSPIANLVDNTFRGVLPGLAFTEPPASDPEDLPVERTEFLRQYLGENIREAVVDYLGDLGIEFDEEEVSVEVGELEDVELSLPDGIQEECDDEELREIISDIFKRVVEEEAQEEIQLASIEVDQVEEEQD